MVGAFFTRYCHSMYNTLCILLSWSFFLHRTLVLVFVCPMNVSHVHELEPSSNYIHSQINLLSLGQFVHIITHNRFVPLIMWLQAFVHKRPTWVVYRWSLLIFRQIIDISSIFLFFVISFRSNCERGISLFSSEIASFLRIDCYSLLDKVERTCAHAQLNSLAQ